MGFYISMLKEHIESPVTLHLITEVATADGVHH